MAKSGSDEESALVEGLNACEVYIFSVGVVAPFGVGPLSSNPITVRTSSNPLAPPKNLVITHEPSNTMALKLSWDPACPTYNFSYIVSFFVVLYIVFLYRTNVSGQNYRTYQQSRMVQTGE